MRRSAGSLATVLALVLMPPAPLAVLHAQASGPSVPAVQPDTGAAARARITDSIVRRAVDSATRRAVDSTTRHALDSLTKLASAAALRDDTEDRQQWRLATTGLVVLGLVFLVLLVFDMLRGHDVLVESHWGGFGGGVGGTRLSRTLVLAVLLVLTGGMLTAVTLSRPGRDRPASEPPKKPTDSTAAKATTTAQGTSGVVVAPGSTIPSTAPGNR